MTKNNSAQLKKKKLHGVSINELAVLYYLLPYGFQRGAQGSLQHLGLGKKEIDIYHPILKIGIEYDGYKHTDDKDISKNKLCKAAGITLLRIRESYCSRLADNLSINFYLTNNTPLSDNVSDTIKLVCAHINSISNLSIDLTSIDCVKDSDKICDFIEENYVIDRMGETSISKRGQKMTIIRYCTKDDIDVQFEDGTIVRHRDYKSFIKGVIKNPNDKSPLPAQQQYIQQIESASLSQKSHCGQMMTLIKYRTAKDVDVQFEDGTIVKHRHYDEFLQGCIKNPNYRVGETNLSTYGQTMTIIGYRDNYDIDVQFEDGTIVYHKGYKEFLKGRIRNPNNRVGEQSMNVNGQLMTIVAYHGARNIDIQFEDGTIVCHKRYDRFTQGAIRKPVA